MLTDEIVGRIYLRTSTNLNLHISAKLPLKIQTTILLQIDKMFVPSSQFDGVIKSPFIHGFLYSFCLK